MVWQPPAEAEGALQQPATLRQCSGELRSRSAGARTGRWEGAPRLPRLQRRQQPSVGGAGLVVERQVPWLDRCGELLLWLNDGADEDSLESRLLSFVGALRPQSLIGSSLRPPSFIGGRCMPALRQRRAANDQRYEAGPGVTQTSSSDSEGPRNRKCRWSLAQGSDSSESEPGSVLGRLGVGPDLPLFGQGSNALDALAETVNPQSLEAILEAVIDRVSCSTPRGRERVQVARQFVEQVTQDTLSDASDAWGAVDSLRRRATAEILRFASQASHERQPPERH
ncbi:unnamed protein product, partial [Prorocentrum cordatum]